jgi:DNA-binding NtrC family response regulator
MKARPLSLSPSSAFPGKAPAARQSAIRRMLVIGNTAGLVGIGTPEGIEPIHVSWTDFTSNAIPAGDLDLIVPIVDVFHEAAVAFFQLLETDGAATAAVLAVLPEDHQDPEKFALAVKTSDDFLLQPVRPDEWRERAGRLLGPVGSAPAAVADRLTAELGLLQLVGRDPAFLEVVEKIPLIARSGSPALISGETGTGKELFARAIHMVSPRRNQPFIPVDCGALPDNLFENELFGHVRGAFTDAHRDQRGLIALAEGGTLFLDEVDSLSLPAQAKLLRFLQERCYRPLGSERFLRANVNVLAAMNRNPESMVHDKTFRPDLFFRLNVVRLHLVPLRERRSDISWLARHFVAAFAAESGLGAKSLSPAVLARLGSYDWPGNIRELNNVLQRAVVLAGDRRILPDDVVLPDGAGSVAGSGSREPRAEPLSYRDERSLVVDEFERSYVARLFEKHGGNVTRAAREARKDRRAFGRLLKKHGIRSSQAS